MMYILTVREQIHAAFRDAKQPQLSTREYNQGWADAAEFVRDMILRAFPENAVAHSFNANFDEIVRRMGYVKLEPGQCVVDAALLRSLTDAMCRDTCQACDSVECPECWVEELRQNSVTALNREVNP